MRVLQNCRMWISRARHQPLPIRVLAACSGLLTVAAALTAPAEAEADSIDNAFLAALDGAGVNYGDPASTVSLAQSVCPTLAKEGETFATVAQSVTGRGISPGMADMFTAIAIQMYCPSAIASIEKGQMPSLPQIPGVPGL